jgi:hypothetical protein
MIVVPPMTPVLVVMPLLAVSVAIAPVRLGQAGQGQSPSQ